MKKPWILYYLCAGAFAWTAYGDYSYLGDKKVWLGYAEAKITLQVVDSEGLPVSGAKVRAGLFNSKYKDVRQPFIGNTDTNGLFFIEGSTIQDVEYHVEKEGFYYTRGTYDFRGSAPAGEQAVVDGKWQPWNPTRKIELKEIRNPIPLFAKLVKSEIPKEEVPLGFDLLMGEWVEPYGKGKTPDIFFNIKRLNDGKSIDVRLDVSFSNQNDGLQIYEAAPHEGSYYRFPYLAPEEGYQTYYVQHYGKREDGSYYGYESPEQTLKNYIFRIRTIIDERGAIKSSLYGKISGQISIQGAGNDVASVRFLYYLNPTINDRNIEYDMKRNLFKNLTFWENMISEP